MKKNEARRCESDYPAADARLGRKRRRQPSKRGPAIRLGASRTRLGALVEQTLGRQKRSECSIRVAAQSKMRRCATHDLKSKEGTRRSRAAGRQPADARESSCAQRPGVRRGFRFPNRRRRKRAVTMQGELEKRRRKHSLSFAWIVDRRFDARAGRAGNSAIDCSLRRQRESALRARNRSKERRRGKRETPPEGGVSDGSQTATCFRREEPHYHRRGGVSRSCSGWEGVVPPRHGRLTN